MTVYDSSVLIEYLAGDDSAVEYVERRAGERAVAPPLVLFEVYQGEVFKSGQAAFDAVDSALSWLEILDTSASFARSAAELQAELQERGTPLAPRDAMIAGAAVATNEPLAVADDDFRVDGIEDVLELDVL